MPRASTLKSLADLAEDQWGLFTRRQAEATGMAWSTLSRMAREGVVERVAHGVYRLRGMAAPDHVDLRAAWLQLAPDTAGWERAAGDGVVSHRSAAALYGLGHLPADVHEFTLPTRRQSRRPDVRFHRGTLTADEWRSIHGLPVTRPSRTAADLLAVREDPTAVGHLIADALRTGQDHAAVMAHTIAPHARRFGLHHGDGSAMLRWLLELTNAPERHDWLEHANANQKTRSEPGP